MLLIRLKYPPTEFILTKKNSTIYDIGSTHSDCSKLESAINDFHRYLYQPRIFNHFSFQTYSRRRIISLPSTVQNVARMRYKSLNLARGQIDSKLRLRRSNIGPLILYIFYEFFQIGKKQIPTVKNPTYIKYYRPMDQLAHSSINIVDIKIYTPNTLNNIFKVA